jgi:pyruvate-ferredoxin/flavodoxin oxidoreductase
MQPCFFALTDVMDLDRAVGAIKESITAAYGRRGRSIVERNEAAVDRAIAELTEVTVPTAVSPSDELEEALGILESASDNAETDFIDRVTMTMIANKGDLLPVSAMPIDGTFPTGTTKFEKRKLAIEIPVWEPELCIDCGKCAVVCPHATIRMKAYEPAALDGAPDGFLTKNFRSRELDGH